MFQTYDNHRIKTHFALFLDWSFYESGCYSHCTVIRQWHPSLFLPFILYLFTWYVYCITRFHFLWVISCKPLYTSVWQTSVIWLGHSMTQCLPRMGFLNAMSKKLMFQDSAYPHPPTKKICHCILSLVTLVTVYTYMIWIILDCSGLCIKYFLGLVGII